MLNKRFIIISIILLFISIAAVSAATEKQLNDNLTVSNENDIVLGMSIDDINHENNESKLSSDESVLKAPNSEDNILSAPDAGTRAALTNKINNAVPGSTITLENDYLFKDGNTNSQIHITKDITIDGQGYTIDANSLGRIFNINSGYTVTLKNITFKNAKYVTTASNDGGGAIHSKAINLTIMDCIFDSNVVTHSNKGGGALYTSFTEGASINIINSNFTKNTGSNGGALHFDNPNNQQHGYSVNIEECNFAENYLTLTSNSLGGGAVFIARSVDTTVKSSKFTENDALSKDGGAIRYSGTTTVIDCEFYSNTASYGAALCFGQAVDLNVYDSLFANNTAKEEGGAVKARFFTIDNATFINNTAKLGGALYSRSSVATLQNSRFLNNSASTQGGALFVNEEVNNLAVDNNDFIHNNAPEGGALYSNSRGTVTTTVSNFYNNSANLGGAIYINQGKFTLSGSTLENNTATIEGGAIDVRASGTEIKNSILKNNSAPLGGAVYWYGDNGKVSESYFISNHATNGTSIIWRGNSGTIEKSTFNDENIIRGSVFWNGQDGRISDSTFLTSKAVYVSDQGDVNFDRNTELASESGDYIVYVGNKATFDSNNFNNLIYNYGLITSPTYIVTLNNKTKLSNTRSVVVYTQILDDNNNTIRTADNLINIYDSTNLPTTYNGTHYVSTINDLTIGEHRVSSTGYNASKFSDLTVQTGGILYLVINLTVNQTNYGEKVVITTTLVNTTYNGTVDIALNDIHYNVTLSNGTAVLTLYNLAPNTYDIVATYMEFNQTVSAEVEIKVELRNSTINVTANNIYYGNTTTIKVNVTNGTTGTVYLFVNDNMYTIKLINSTGQVNITDMPGGNYTVYALYNGDAYFDSSHNSTKFSVYKYTPQINITANDIYVGQIATINVQLPNDASGKVDVYIGDNVYSYINKTHITIYESDLTAGNASVRVIYGGNDKYYSANATKKFNVTKKNMDITIRTTDIPVGENETVTVVIPADAKGIILLTINGTNYFEYADNTVARFHISGLAKGTYNVTATYNEGPIYNTASVNSSFRVFAVKAFDFNVSATTDDDLNVLVNISLPKDIDGDVYVEINGTNYTAHMSKGKDVVIIPGLEGGQYTGRVYLVNDSKYENANRTFIVNLKRFAPTIDVDYNHTIFVGDDAIIKVTINDDATGNITITINNTNYTQKINNGVATFNITGLVWNNYLFNVTFVGDRKYLPDEKEYSLEVSRIHNYYANLEVHDIYVGETATIKVTLENDTTGTVTLKINGTTHTIILENGTGSIDITGLPVGNHPIDATYNGDGKYEPSNRVFDDFHVKKIVDYPFTPEGKTNDTHANITVTLPADANGYVNITVNGRTYTNIAVINGHANLTVDGLTAGTEYPVKIDYSGNFKYEFASRNITLNSNKTLNYNFTVSGDDIHVGEVAYIEVFLPEANETDLVRITVGDRDPVFIAVGNGTIIRPVYNLDYGNYSVIVEYQGNDKFEASLKSTVIYVSKISSYRFDVITNQPTVGDNLTVNIVLPDDSNGTANVTISINGTIFPATVINGTANVTIPNMPQGKHNVTVIYSGNDKYHNATKTVQIIVEKIENYEFTVTPVDIYVGENETIKVVVPKDVTGEVLITIDNTEYINKPVTIVNGIGWFNVTGLAIGQYVVHASLKNDPKYEEDTIFANFKVSPIADYLFNVTVSNPNYVRDNITFTVELPENATGNVSVIVFGKTYQGKVNQGVAIVNITAPYDGTYPYKVSFEEEGKYALKTQTGSVVISKIPVVLDPDYPVPVHVGENVTIKVQLPKDATGIISVISRLVTYSTPLVNGSATIILPGYPLAQSYSPYISYNGDDRYFANSTPLQITVIKVSDYNLTVNVSDIHVGQTEIVNITLPSDATDDVLIYGNFSDNRYSKEIINGNVSFNIADLKAGTYNITVLYQGFDKYESKNVTKIFTVRKVNSTIGIELVNRTIVVSVPDDATGTVRITIDTIDENVAIVNGKAILDVSSVLPGEYLVTADYDGDENYFGNDTSKMVTIPKFDDYLINVTVEDIIVGENATVIVHLPSDANGFANITVNDAIYSNVEVKNGIATLYVTKLAVGTYNAAVNFTNSKYAFKTNSTKFNVVKIKTILHTSVSVENQTATITVGINENATGNITVYVDGKPYSKVIENNQVQLTLDLMPGDHIVQSHYDGDTNHTSADTTISIIEIEKIKDYDLIINLTELITVVENNNITVTFPEKAHGRVTIYVGEDFYNTEIDPTTHNATVTLPFLKEGIYYVFISYSDELYDYMSNSSTFKVIKLNTTLDVDVENITKDLAEIINITLNENATGDVLINVNGTVYHKTLENGKTNLTLTNLNDGNYTVIVTYEGDDLFYGNSTSINFTVTKIPVEITVNSSDIIVGGVLKINFNMSREITDLITVQVGQTNHTTFVYKGNGSLDVYNLPVGDYNITVYYAGDKDYLPVSNSTNISVIPKKSSLMNVSVADITVGENITVNINTTEPINGTVYVTIAGLAYTSELVNGKTSFNVSNLIARDYTISAFFMGNENYDPCNATSTFTVHKKNTNIDLEVSDINIGQYEIVNVTVNENATGYVLISIGTIKVYANLTDGRASAIIRNVAVGKYNVTVNYIGDANFNPNSTNKSFTVSQLKTDITINGSDIYVGQIVEFNITTSANITEVVIINIADNTDTAGKNYTSFVENGKGNFTVYGLPEGDYIVTVYFNGNAQYAAVNNTTTIKVNAKKASQITVKVNNITVGENITVNINTTEPINGTVYVTIAGLAYTTELVNGKASFDVSNLIARDYTISAFFMGNENYDPCNATSTFTVHKKNTNIDLEVSDINIGQYEIVNVTVNENATGYVLISIGTIKVYANLTDGRASAIIRNVAVGKYNVTVNYIGDANFNPNSTNKSFTVSQLKTDITINGSDIYVGQSVMFNITTSANITEVVIINIADNTDTAGKNYTSFVEDGKGNFTVYGLPEGDYIVTVYFNGNAQYAAVNNTTTIKVNAKKASQVTVKVDNITVGENAVIYVNVTEGTTGTITVIVAGNYYTKELNDSKANFTISGLIARDYHVSAVYLGDDYYLLSNSSANFTVSKKVTAINATAKDINVGEIETIRVNLTEGATGVVLIDINGTKYYANITDSKVSLDISNLAVGKYNVTVIYRGDNNFLSNETKINFTVTKLDPEISITLHKVLFSSGEDVIVYLTGPNDVTGVVTVTVESAYGSDTYTAYINNGAGILTIKNLDVDLYNVSAKYQENYKYLAKNTTKLAFEVYQNGTNISVTTHNIDVGQKETIIVTFPEGKFEGNVTIYVDGVPHNATLVYDATTNITKATLTLDDDFAAGTYDVEATYILQKDGKIILYEGANEFTVSKINSTIEINPIADIEFGENTTVIMKITPSDATGEIHVYVDGILHIVDASNPILELNNLKRDYYYIQAFYMGDNKYLPSEAEVEFNVTKANPDIKLIIPDNPSVFEDALIKVTINDTATVYINLVINGQDHLLEIENGQVNYTIKATPAGTYDVVAYYLGDNNYNNATVTGSFVVTNDGNFLVNSTGIWYETLAEAVVASNGTDVIIGKPGTYTGTGNIDVEISGKNLTITGSDVIFDAENADVNLLNIAKGANVTLVGLTYTNVRSTDKGAVVNNGNLTVIGSEFVNNSAKYGGAIYSVGTLNIEKSVFANNTATSDGGAIYYTLVNGEFNVIDSTFINNKASLRGGAIFVWSGLPTVEGSEFYNNTAYSNGGAICLWRAVGEIDNSYFENNSATNGAGGAVNLAVGGSVTNSEFVDNHAFMTNGILTVGGTDSYVGNCNFTGAYSIDVTGTATLENNVELSPKVTDGYSVRNIGKGLTLINNKFNSTIINKNNAVILSEVNVTVLDNKTYDTTEGTYTLNATIKDDNGNVIYDQGVLFTVNGVEVPVIAYDDSTGLYTAEFTLTGDRLYEVGMTKYDEAYINIGILRNITGTFTELQKLIDESRGFVILDHSFAYDPVIDGEKFLNGVLIDKDMAMFNFGNDIVIDGKNQARIFNITNDSMVMLGDVTLANGNASKGGAIYVDAGSTLIAGNIKFINNTATLSAGAIYADGDASISNSVFVNNTAITAYGIYVSENGVLSTLTDSTFDSDNFIYNEGHLLLDNVTELSAKGPNYVIHNDGSLNLNGNHFNNTIYNDGVILTEVTITLNGNKTITDKEIGDSVVLNATFVDDNGNAINDIYFRIAVDGVAINNINYDLANNLYTVNYVINHAGETLVSTLYENNDVTVLTGIYFIPKFNATINVTVDDIYVGENATVKVNVTGEPGIKYNETIIVTINSTEYIVTLENGFVSFNVTGLTPGQYSVLAIFSENANYTKAYGNDIFTVKKLDVPISGDDIEIVYGENATVIVKGLENIVGDFITINITGKGSKTVKVNASGMANATFDNLAVGEYEIVAGYAGNATYAANATTATLTVLKANSTISIDVESIYKVGDDIVINFTVKNSTGDVTVTINGKSYPVVDNKNVTIVGGLPEGEYIINAILAGDENYAGSNASATFNVVKNNITITINDITTPIVVGSEITIVAELNETVTGDVVFTINGANYTAHIDNDNKTSVKYTPVNNETITVVATFMGNDKYNRNSTTKAFDVNRVPINVTVEFNTPIFVGGDAVITIKLNESINATVKLNVNGGECYVAVVNGVGTYTISNLANDTYAISAIFAGDDKYLGNVSSVETLEVNKIPTNITVVVTPSDINVGETAVVKINMNPTINAYVELKIDGKTYTVAIVNGVGSYEVSGLDSGVYDVNVTYAGDDKYIESKNTTTLTVGNATLVVDVSALNVTVEQNTSFIINVNDDFKGNVSITVDGDVLYNGTVKSLISAGKLLAGDKVATVVFYGDDNYDELTVTAEFVVSRVTPTIDVVIDDVTYPAKAVAEITVGNNANGTVNITVDGKVFNGTVENGKATVDLTGLSAGAKVADVRFFSTDNYNDNVTASAKFNVNKANSTIVIGVEDVYVYNDTVVITLTTIGSDGAVTVTINGKSYKVTDNKVTADDLAAGDYTIIANLADNENYTAATNSTTFKVKQAGSNITIGVESIYKVGDNVVISLTPVNSTGNVTVTVNGKSYKVTDNKVTIDDVQAGEYIINAVLAGDENYTGSSANATFSVVKDNITISIDDITTPIVVGSEITIVAELNETVTGDVIFTINGANYIAHIDNDNKTSVKYTPVNNKTIAVVATFMGNDKYNNISTTGSFDVVKVPTEIEVTVKEPVTYGENAVISIELDAPLNTTVKLTVDGTDYNVGLINGKGSFNVSGLNAGPHEVNVTYAGDAKYIGSNDTKTFTVEKVADLNADVTALNVTVEQNTSFVIDVPDDFNGNVSITVDGKKLYNGPVKTIINADTLTAGDKTADVVFYGDDNYDELTVTAEFTVSRVTPEITVDIDDVTCPDNAVAEITVGNNANGTVNITVDGKVFNGTVENGKATVDLTGLSAGAKVADVEFFSTDDYNDNAAASAKFNINKAGSSIDIDVNATYYVDEGIVITLRPTNSTGAISVTINGEKYDVKDNKVTIPNGLSADSYTIVANLAGDDNYEASDATATFDVIKYESDISIEVKDVFVVDEEIVIALNTENATDVSVTINGKPYTVVDNRVVIPNGLANGTYFIVAKFNGDDKYLASEANATFGVNKLAPTDVTAEDLTFVVGHEGILEITGPADRTANLIVSVGDDDYNVELKDGKATLDVSKLSVGEYNVDITYLENDKYTKAEFTNAATITVNDKDKADVNVTVDAENKTITVELPENATGNVTVIIDGKVYNVTDVAESPVIINISDIEPGNHTIEVIYSGDDNFNPASNVTDVEVPKVDDYEITVDAEVDGNSVDITVTLPQDVTGPVLIDVDGVGYYANVTDGQAKLHLDDLSAGDHDVVVKYPGDDYYAPKGNATSFTVDASETPINIDVQDDKIVIELPDDATGNVTVTIDGKNQTVPVEDGKAVVDISDLEPGNHTIDVTYPGDDNYKPASNSTTFDVPKISDYPINVTEEDGKLVVNVPEDATGNVTVTIDGKEYTAPIEDGKAVVDISDVEPGKHAVDVTYPGDDKYGPASNATIIDVPKISDYPFEVVTEDIKAGEKTNITINLPEDVNGQVLVDIDGVGYYANVTDGVAHVELTLDLKPGTYDVVVTFPGNDKYEGKSVSDSFTVESGETPMDVKVEDGKVIVELPEDATGDVTVTIDGKNYTVPIKDGKAVMDLPSDLEPGEHTVDVTYPGDSKYAPASNSTTVDVPKIDDYSINVTNTDDELVIDVPDDATGDVIVTIDGKNYTVPINDGKAVMDISDLPAGEHDVKVTYPGNDKYAPKTVNTTIDKKRELVITAPDVVKYYSGPERFVIYASDDKGNKIDGLTFKITINDVTYERTSKDGQASLALNLNSGNYTVKIEFTGTSEFEPQNLTANVEILPTIYANDVFKVFRNGTQYYALFLDGEGNPLANTEVSFNIHGVFYTRTTNASGWAKLNINLERGKYILTAINPVTGEMKSNNITVISLIVENKDIIKYFRNGTQYTARIILPNGSYAGAGEAVTFNINGVFYTRYTDANGYVKLNINLEPGDYVVTVGYRDCVECNTVKVLPTLITSDLVMNYDDGSQFVAQALDGRGNPYPNQVVSCNVHGVIYNRMTDSNGMVKLNIHLQRGEYLMTSQCNGEVHSNKILVK